MASTVGQVVGVRRPNRFGRTDTERDRCGTANQDRTPEEQQRAIPFELKNGSP